MACGAARPARLRRRAVGQLRMHQQRRARRGQHRQRGRHVRQRRVGEVVDACGRAAGGRRDVRIGLGLGHAGAALALGWRVRSGLRSGDAGARAPDGHRNALRPSAPASSSARSAAGSRALAGTSPPQKPASTHSLPCAALEDVRERHARERAVSYRAPGKPSGSRPGPRLAAAPSGRLGRHAPAPTLARDWA